MRNIGKSKIYIVPELTASNEQWINPGFGDPDLQVHYDNIKRMVKEKTGRAMQEKERDRKGKNGKTIKVAGCSPIREGRVAHPTGHDTGRRAKIRRGMSKTLGHHTAPNLPAQGRGTLAKRTTRSRGQGRVSKVGERWFKPNYHAHIVFDWMNHDTGKSRKLNEEDMTEMQSLASDILLMERGQSKAVTGKEHLERNDFIIEKQKKEMKRLDTTRQYREHQLEMANQKMQEAESVTNSLLKDATKERQSKDLDKAISEKRSKLNREKGSELLNAAVGWATGKSKALKNEIEDLRSEISTHEETIERLQDKIQTMQDDHHRELVNLKSKHQSELSRKETEHAQENHKA